MSDWWQLKENYEIQTEGCESSRSNRVAILINNVVNFATFAFSLNITSDSTEAL